MPKNLLILKFLYGRDRPRGFFASKELSRNLKKSQQFMELTFLSSFAPANGPGPTLLKKEPKQ